MDPRTPFLAAALCTVPACGQDAGPDASTEPCCGAPDGVGDTGDPAGDTGASGDSGDAETGHPTLVVQLDEDRLRADDNPLRGFYTSYAWGEPVTDHPASLEFAYVALSDVMDGPDSMRFHTGLEPLLVAAESRGHQLVFRPYIDYPGLPSGLPAFLEGQVDQRSYAEHGGGWSPDYADPELQAAILTFIDALGARYDGDPRLAVVQLGLLGFWGEWHTWPHSEWFADPLFQDEVLGAYDAAFSTTLLQVRYGSEASVGRRVGYHDDSFAYSTIGDIDWFFLPQLEAVGAQDRWHEVPVGGELRPELQGVIFESDYATGTYQQDFDACVEATHASFLLDHGAFGFQPDSATEAEATRVAARSLGYALHLAEARLDTDTLVLVIENLGVAPFYLPLRVQVVAASGAAVEAALPMILPDAGRQEVSLDVDTLPSPEPEAPWTVGLVSDHVLPSQTVRFVTAPGTEAIRVE